MRVKLLLICFLGFVLLLSGCAKPIATENNNKNMSETYNQIRRAAVAGQFYPGDAETLKKTLKKYFAGAKLGSGLNFKPLAIMVPHAGYAYSGPVAAYSYQALGGQKIGTVVLISNSHTAYFKGVAVDESDAWETPLGFVRVDRALADKIVAAGAEIKYNSQAHKTDHVLEVQLPFLQTVLAGNFKIVPILFGNSGGDDYKKLARALADNLGEDDLVVVSSDMSHYPAYADANRIDQATLKAIKNGDISELEKHIEAVEAEQVANEQTLACGIDAIKTVLELARILGWDRTEILHYANSGDVAIGDKAQVVGYGAVAFGKTDEAAEGDEGDQNQTTPSPSLEKEGDEGSAGVNELNDKQKKELLKIARETVEAYVKFAKAPEFTITDERLNWKEGAFVTLHKNGSLRGCIGQIVPSEKPLWQVVRDMAIAACSDDPRFSPVSEDELDSLDYEVSVLSAPERIDDWRKIKLGKHGVIVRKGFYSGVFLPQVADETGWGLEKFLGELCSQKAGLPADCYKNNPDVIIEVFTAQVFS